MVFNEPGKLINAERVALLRFILLIGVVLVASPFAWAHKGHHLPAEQASPKVKKDGHSLKVLEINAKYKVAIKPVFQRACFDCHTSETRYPWYAQFPFVRSLIERDVTDARKHLDMSGDFPFKGHGTIEEDLAAVAESVQDGSMPPLSYRIMHAESRLSETDKQGVLDWVDESLKALKE